MAFHTHALSPSETVAAPAAPRAGLLSRLLAAMMESRQRQADREIARYLALSGGRLTDATEREIERRFLAGSSAL